MERFKTYVTVSLVWIVILTILHLIDFHYENFLKIFYAIISNLVLFGLYLLSIIIVDEFKNNKLKQ